MKRTKPRARLQQHTFGITLTLHILHYSVTLTLHILHYRHDIQVQRRQIPQRVSQVRASHIWTRLFCQCLVRVVFESKLGIYSLSASTPRNVQKKISYIRKIALMSVTLGLLDMVYLMEAMFWTSTWTRNTLNWKGKLEVNLSIRITSGTFYIKGRHFSCRPKTCFVYLVAGARTRFKVVEY